jgi:hypothetical protein
VLTGCVTQLEGHQTLLAEPQVCRADARFGGMVLVEKFVWHDANVAETVA